MAQRYRKIDPRMWRDENIRKLDHIEKLIAIYAFTAQSNRIGIFNFSPALAAEDLSLEVNVFRLFFEKVCRTFEWRFDDKLRVLYIPTWWKYNAPENPSVFKNCLNDLHDLPATHLLDFFFANTAHLSEHLHGTFESYSPTRATQRVESGSPAPVADKEQEQEQEPEQEPDRGSSKGSPTSGDSSEPAASMARPKRRGGVKPATLGQGDVVVMLPLTSDKEAPVTEDFVAEMEKAYPGVDVRHELGRMRAWLIGNPKRKKTASGIGRFVTSWLTTQQDSGGTTARRPSRNQRHAAPAPPTPERKTDFRDRYIDGQYMREEFDIETGAVLKTSPHPSSRPKP
jgi:hypothetical protein